MTTINFTKMHGLGNDFIIIDALQSGVDAKKLFSHDVANRYCGIGFDQALVIEPSDNADFFCRIFNADGQEAEQCGNGLRCVARYVHENGLIKKNNLTIATKAGVSPLIIHDYDHIEIMLSEPTIVEKLVSIPVTTPGFSHIQNTLPVSILSLGNPHAILRLQATDELPMTEVAAHIAKQKYFPNGANVGFMHILDTGRIRLRTIERGVGETYACGSNACAAVVAGRINNWLQEQVQVDFKLGSLTIAWPGEGSPITMIGPATRVFAGSINI